MNKKRTVIIMGTPGSGKGTQAELIVKKFGFKMFDTGELLRKFFKNGDKDYKIEIGEKEYTYTEESERYDTGLLNSTPFTLHLMEQKIREEVEDGQSLVFGGSPRTEEEASKLLTLLDGFYGRENLIFFYIQIDAEDTIHRNSHRRVCELMEHSILWSEETKKLKHCPLDGSKLVSRRLDDPEIIKKRLEVFEDQTLPAINWAKDNGYNVIEIDGRPSVSEVFESISKHL